MIGTEGQTNNFPEGRHVFKGTRVLVYPGYKGGNGCTENLTTYRENPVFFPGTDVIRSGGLAFDIERLVEWDPLTLELVPFSYSMMIDGSYPVSKWEFLGRKTRPTMEEFTSIAESLPGFVLDKETTKRGLYAFRNLKDNLFINWGKHHGVITIGVIQQEPVSDLRTVTDEIVPNAVEIFNRLSPTWQIGKELVRRSVEEALKGSKIIPQKRTA